MWLRADLGVTAAIGPVTATGTTPPTVTLSGTPTAAQTVASTPYVELDCTTLGILGVSKFTVKVNGTVTATNVTSAASGVVLTGSGLTAGWAAGASAVNDVYKANITVSAWADQSPNARSLVQATGTLQPQYNASDPAYGGQATVQFSNQVLSCTWTGIAQPVSEVIVGESTSGASQQQYTEFNSIGAVIYWSGSLWSYYAGAGASKAGATSRGPQVMAATFNKANSGTNNLYINNLEVAALTTETGTLGFGTSSNPMYIGGASSVPASPLIGKIAELVLVSGILPASTLSRYATYASNRYAGNGWQ